MSLGHAPTGRILSVTRISGDVVRTDYALAIERRREHLRVSRHGKFRERLHGSSRQGVERVALAGLVDQVVEEGPKFRA